MPTLANIGRGDSGRRGQIETEAGEAEGPQSHGLRILLRLKAEGGGKKKNQLEIQLMFYLQNICGSQNSITKKLHHSISLRQGTAGQTCYFPT